MEKQDRELDNDRRRTLVRLAALQRMRDEASQKQRPAMLKTIERMIAAESDRLRKQEKPGNPSGE